MKKIFSLVAMLLLAFNAQAVVLTFDDTSAGGLVSNYGGLNWAGSWGVLNTTTYIPSGYVNGVTSGTNVAYNGGAQTVSVNSGIMDWNGANFTGAWNDGLNITAIGYLNGVEMYNQTIVVDTSGPVWFDANFMGIDNLVLSSYGGIDNSLYSGAGAHFAMDDFTFNASVPEASVLLMMGLGLFGLGVARRRI